MNTDSAVNTLISQYSSIFDKKGLEPDWAIRKANEPTKLVHPSIPFVGKKYFAQPVKMLVYASAENLTKYTGHLDDDVKAINRHRLYFDQSVQVGEFFPCVHIGPFDTGSLTLCAYYILSKFMHINDVDPAEFLESISFGNYGKYTVKPSVKQTKNGLTEENIDYAGDPQKLKESHDYIVADIEELKPDLIVIIDSTYNGAGSQKDFITPLCPTATIVPIMQILPRNINFRIAPNYSPHSLDDLDETTVRWYQELKEGGITGKTKDKFRSVFSYLDAVIERK